MSTTGEPRPGASPASARAAAAPSDARPATPRPDTPRPDTPAPDSGRVAGLWADDRRLVEACTAERPGAWADLVERYAPLVAAVARRTLRARGLRPTDEDIEDICENSFLALLKDDYRVLRAYDDRYALTTYLGVVARTHAGRFVRRKRLANAPLEEQDAPAPESTDPALAVEKKDLERAVRETLAELSPRDQKILELFYFSSFDYQAIALSLGIAVNSIGAALHRARERLKKRLQREAPGRG